LTGFPVLFVSMVRGDRVGYRVQRGFPGAGQGKLMRREMTFCTHCVSGAERLVVEDAAAEPFFRGSKAVQRFGVRAYVGVPLRTSAGVVIGTLCGLDTTPRRSDPHVVALLELFAAPVVAEIELARGTAARDALLERHEGGAEVYAAPWYSRLLEIELARAEAGRPAALVALRGASAAEAAALAAPGEVVGRLGEPGAEGPFALLLSGADERAAAARCAGLEAGERGVRPRATFAPAGAGSGTARTVPDWWSRALG
jgi:GAF domain-containing protein